MSDDKRTAPRLTDAEKEFWRRNLDHWDEVHERECRELFAQIPVHPVLRLIQGGRA